MLAGALIKWNLTLYFDLTGGLTLLTMLWAVFQPALKSLSDDVATPSADQPLAVDDLP